MNLPRSRFTEHLARLNGLRLSRWALEPGMRFGAPSAWWSEGRARARPHNGLDLVRYEAEGGGLESLGEGSLVPLAWEGRVAGIIDDVLACTVLAAHEAGEGARRLCSLYGHVAPVEGVVLGTRLAEGAAAAFLSRRAGARVPPHLHLSVALVPAAMLSGHLTWRELDSSPEVTFLDPLPLLSRPAGQGPSSGR